MEARAVDYGGVVDMRMMNDEDLTIAESWKESGFLTVFRRIPYKTITKFGESHFVELSEEAFSLAHEERIARSKRSRSPKWNALEE
jgi:hypothetical protein